MKDFAKHFYESAAWRSCRAAYLLSVGGLCERCLAKGLYEPALVVHHIIYLTPFNINNLDITLGWDNLEAICQDCHNKEHHKVEINVTSRIKGFDEDGQPIPIADTLPPFDDSS